MGVWVISERIIEGGGSFWEEIEERRGWWFGR